MTELIYKVGDEYFTTRALALVARDMSGKPMTCIYRPVEQYTPEQKAAFSAHAKKAAEYRAAHKKEG